VTDKIQVVVIGGGYAGVMAANRLTQRDDVAVTLINPRPAFVERMRLHRLVAGTGDAVTDLAGILSPRIRLVVDAATRIRRSDRKVDLLTGESVDYDFLVLAVGSTSGEPRLPGMADHAHPMATLEAAERLRSAIEASPASAAITVIGAGITGIETAAELAEQGRAVTLLCGEVLGRYLHPGARAAVAQRLTKLGVTVLEGSGTRASAVTRDTVRLADGRELPSAITIWTAGFGVPELAARSGLSTDAVGRLLTDETLTSIDDTRIVAAGDAAAPSGLAYRMSAYAAQPLGAHAADTVLSRIAGREPGTIELGFFGLCVALGRRSATLQVARADDSVTRFHLSGRLVALLVKEAGTKGVLHQLVREGRKPGSFKLLRRDPGRQQRLPGERGALTRRANVQ
jgi:NADH dehydrogenase FAD-containing subunit